ncbi:MAG: TolC family protein [Deltaproteobacteria bacterium]|nr:TolC family protein [Deltaproteobacteria bacterium]
MKRLSLFFFVLFFFPFTLSASPTGEHLTLNDCYQLTLKRSETLKLSEEDIKISEAHFLQALGTILPRINLNYSEFFQDDSSNGDPTVSSSLTQFRRPQAGIGMSLTLFRGFREFYALRSSKIDAAEKEFKKKEVERLLYGDVATAFFTVASLEAEMKSQQKIKKIVKERITEIQNRIQLGKSRDSEYAAQAAELSLIEADLEKKKGDLRIAYELLGLLTGLTPQPPIKIEELNIVLGHYEDWKSNLAKRSDLQAQNKAIELAKEDIKVQRSYLLPQLDFNANTWIYRSGYQNDILWDTTLNLSVPLFNFSTFGNIREARIKTKQEEIRKEELNRSSEKEVGRDYVNLRSSLEQLKKYKLAAKMTEMSYQQQVKDYQQNLVTNLDVLQSQRTWMQALEQSQTAQVQVWAAWAKLKMSSGKIAEIPK